MNNRIFAIGDLHGHFSQWLRLYDKLLKDAELDPEKDTLVFLGDMVDGGDEVKQTISWLIDNTKKYPHWVVLRGNHEDLMTDALLHNGQIYGSYDLWYQQGGKETYMSYVSDKHTAYEKALMQVKDVIGDEHLQWIDALPLYHETPDYFFVHAGLLPDVTIESHKEQLSQGNEHLRRQMLWIRDEFIDSNYNWGKKIIFGHTTFKKPCIMNNKIGIDGMFHNNGHLWALDLPSEKIYEELSV